MALGFFPVFNPPLNDVNATTEGTSLLSECENLDQLAMHLGVSPLTSFTDSRNVPDDFDGDPDELDELMGKWDEWLSAEEGFATISALKDSLENNPEVSKYFRKPKQLVEELSDLARLLQVAKTNGSRFRLEVG